MLQLTFTQASRFQNVCNKKSLQILIKKKKIFIGRGQQLHQLQNNQNQIIDLNGFQPSLSRVHAGFLFSPAWFYKNKEQTPKYLFLINKIFNNLTDDLKYLICEFLQNKKQCFIKDLKSKFGLFKKINEQFIQPEMTIQFVQGVFITFQYCEKYQNLDDFLFSLKLHKQQTNPPIILGNINEIITKYNEVKQDQLKKLLLLFWRIRNKEQKYILLTKNNLILKIGRASHCDIQIKDSAISRYQAHLKCQNYKWKIIDGNQIQKSKNGTWIKLKYIPIHISNKNQQLITIKLGIIQCQVKLIAQLPWLNINKILNEKDMSQSFIRIGLDNQINQ